MTDSTVLAHRLEGEGPPVVLLNGGMMTFPSWEAIAAPLRARYRLLRFDFRGQLLSPPTSPATPRISRRSSTASAGLRLTWSAPRSVPRWRSSSLPPGRSAHVRWS